MNGCGHGIIRDRSRGGFHMRNEQRQMSFAAFGQMDFVTYPRCAPLLAVVSLFVVGRADVARWRRNILESYASERHPQHGSNFASRLAVSLRRPEPGEATQELSDHTGHQATLCPAARSLRQTLDAQLPPQANANLHYEDHSAPPTLVDYEHAASREPLPQ